MDIIGASTKDGNNVEIARCAQVYVLFFQPKSGWEMGIHFNSCNLICVMVVFVSNNTHKGKQFTARFSWNARSITWNWEFRTDGFVEQKGHFQMVWESSSIPAHFVWKIEWNFPIFPILSTVWFYAIFLCNLHLLGSIGVLPDTLLLLLFFCWRTKRKDLH